MAEGKQYTVVIAGAGYLPPGGSAPLVAFRGQVIRLDDAEAQRLSDLGAIREATDADVQTARARQQAQTGFVASADNPFGGTPLESPEDHAQRVLAETGRTEGQQPQPGVFDVRGASDVEVQAFVSEASAKDVVEAAAGDPELATRLLRAEQDSHDGKPRQAVVKGLSGS
jgi:hypothetical protein